MKISTLTSHLAKVYGEENAIRKLARIGYDCYDFSMFGIGEEGHPINSNSFESYVQKLRKAADDSGIECNQSHAPFPSYLHDDKEYNKRMFPLLVRAIEVTGLLGGEIVIVHPAVFPGHKIGGDSLCWDTNMELYHALLPHAKKSNVKIALENMFNWYEGASTASPATCSSPEEFVKYMDALDPEYFVACVDIGHSAMENAGGRSPAEMIRALGGKRLKALHVHDNDLVRDVHTLPFNQKIDWDEVMTALRDIGYDGELTFEADAFLSQFPNELAVHASRLMLEVGRYFVDKYEL
ncbi:MAG TPA: sugar phosphate isomerase/epimerase family protein [Clostridia bacterium]|nr:sugar phosphate isomerase/epimerase family protein [Clostridia bacterium]